MATIDSLAIGGGWRSDNDVAQPDVLLGVRVVRHAPGHAHQNDVLDVLEGA